MKKPPGGAAFFLVPIAVAPGSIAAWINGLDLEAGIAQSLDDGICQPLGIRMELFNEQIGRHILGGELVLGGNR